MPICPKSTFSLVLFILKQVIKKLKEREIFHTILNHQIANWFLKIAALIIIELALQTQNCDNDLRFQFTKDFIVRRFDYPCQCHITPVEIQKCKQVFNFACPEITCLNADDCWRLKTS